MVFVASQILVGFTTYLTAAMYFTAIEIERPFAWNTGNHSVETFLNSRGILLPLGLMSADMERCLLLLENEESDNPGATKVELVDDAIDLQIESPALKKRQN